MHATYELKKYVEENCAAGPSVRAVCGMVQRSLARWACGFDLRRAYGCLSVVSVVCCQVEVSATSWSLVQRVLPTAVRRCVWSRNLKKEEATARVGPQSHRKKMKLYKLVCMH